MNFRKSQGDEHELLLGTPSLMAELRGSSSTLVPGFVDYKRRPAVRSNYGCWRSAAFIIGVEMAERLSYYGIAGNLISFLTGKLGQSTAVAAATVNAWFGVASLLPILGAVIADSFVGKYYTIIVSSLIYILGLGLLTLSATVPSLSCLNHEKSIITERPRCSPHLQIVVFFIALYMVALGEGGHKPCVQAFGADQFYGEDPKESKAKSSFFNWWYFGVCIGGLLGVAVLSYVQDNLSWGLGFGIPCIILVASLIVFLLGTKTYRYSTKNEGQSPFRRIGRVFLVAARNWSKPCPAVDCEEEASETQPQNGSRQYRFLDKALIATDTGHRAACSKNDVEETKAVLRLFPTWATSLVFAITFSQSGTFFTKQGVTLDRSIGRNFVIPPAALQSLIGICIVIFLPIYDRLLVPLARLLTGKPAGISMLKRIGFGLFISIISMVVAAAVEIRRKQIALQHGLIDLPKATIPMSIWWLLPQYALFGIAEAFTMVGLQEFFYDQVPDEIRCVGMSLYLSIFGIGSLISSVLVSLIDKASSKGGKESWFTNNLNHAHLDFFYWLLAGMSVIALALFIYFSKSYIYNKQKVVL